MIYNDYHKFSHIPVILIVDDNPQNLQVLGSVLQENLYEIEFALSGPAALDWLKIKQFDLILLDINMPEMSGFDVCREIRSNPGLNTVPVIFLSAYTDRESILKGFELGAQDYISKPFDGRELIFRARTHLILKDSLEKLEKLNKSLEDKVSERTLQLKETNDKLEATNLKLIDLDKAKAEFLYLISHEIRTPLNGIVGPLELLKDQTYTSEIGNLVEVLDMSVKRLERFALDAVLITQLKTNNIKIRMDYIVLPELINEVLKEEKVNLQSKNININLKYNPDLPFITGDSELVRKCISNILDNAIFFSPLNGNIEIFTYLNHNNTVCVIHDEGKGFNGEITEEIFRLFTRGKDYRDNSKGTGLPIVKMVMNLHSGDVVLNNHPAGGAQVKLLFPNGKNQ